MIRPTQNRVVLKKKQIEENRKGLLIMPNDHGTPCMATVVAVGPGKRDVTGFLQPLDVALGDVIIYNRHAGQAVTIDDEELLVVYDHDIFAVVT